MRDEMTRLGYRLSNISDREDIFHFEFAHRDQRDNTSHPLPLQRAQATAEVLFCI
jgi:hypothetical protein